MYLDRKTVHITLYYAATETMMVRLYLFIFFVTCPENIKCIFLMPLSNFRSKIFFNQFFFPTKIKIMRKMHFKVFLSIETGREWEALKDHFLNKTCSKTHGVQNIGSVDTKSGEK